jgi:hypothetical protein
VICITRASKLVQYNYAEANNGDHIAHHESGPGGTETVIERDEEKKVTGYEIKLPAAALGQDTFASSDVIAVGVCVNDGDLDPGQGGRLRRGPSFIDPLQSPLYGESP